MDKSEGQVLVFLFLSYAALHSAWRSALQRILYSTKFNTLYSTKNSHIDQVKQLAF